VLYGSAPLVGAAAREARVRAAMPGADVVHLASHYVADEHSPLLSKLLLADEGREQAADAGGGPDGVLQASEVYGMQLPRTRLVVLSACQTGVEQTLRGEGAIGMARSFLSAGVPLVVASLWPVESDATAELMLKFHKYRREGSPSAEALRRAQQDMIHSPDTSHRHPHAWASFVAYGGYAESF
jgi:CHAT domain-containing protein